MPTIKPNLYRYALLDQSSKTRATVTAKSMDAAVKFFQAQRKGKNLPDGWYVVLRERVEPSPSPEFKVGDHVRVKDNVAPRYGWGGVRPGDVGKVARVSGNGLTIDFPKQRGWLGHSSEMETAPQPQPQPAPLQFKKGDRVTGECVTGGRVTGTILRIYPDEARYPYRVMLGDGTYRWLLASTVQAAEPQPKPEPETDYREFTPEVLRAIEGIMFYLPKDEQEATARSLLGQMLK